jgi:hypothetical protein
MCIHGTERFTGTATKSTPVASAKGLNDWDRWKTCTVGVPMVGGSEFGPTPLVVVAMANALLGGSEATRTPEPHCQAQASPGYGLAAEVCPTVPVLRCTRVFALPAIRWLLSLASGSLGDDRLADTRRGPGGGQRHRAYAYECSSVCQGAGSVGR